MLSPKIMPPASEIGFWSIAAETTMVVSPAMERKIPIK
jgi:hypothetical protein